MTYTISTQALHQELREYFEEHEPERMVGDRYVEQFEPWQTQTRELWTDELLEQIASAHAAKRRRVQSGDLD